MSTWVILYAYSDRELMLQERLEQLQGAHFESEVPTYWESPRFVNLWSALSFLPVEQQVSSKLHRIVSSVFSEEHFLQQLEESPQSSEFWTPIDGLPLELEQLAAKLGEEPCELELQLRRAIARSALRDIGWAIEDADAAWPRVANQRADWVRFFQHELAELSQALRDLEARGEKYVTLVIN